MIRPWCVDFFWGITQNDPSRRLILACHADFKVAIAEEAQKSTAQIMIRWLLQKGFVPLPKSDNPVRISESTISKPV